MDKERSRNALFYTLLVYDQVGYKAGNTFDCSCMISDVLKYDQHFIDKQRLLIRFLMLY